MDLSYVLPLHLTRPGSPELACYLSWLGERAEVIVVDSSPEAVFEQNGRAWSGSGVRHLRHDARHTTLNGKVGNVVQGVEQASHEQLLVADDDVRYDEESLRRMRCLLQDDVVVRPQNYFDPLPWHAWWDTGRMLIARAAGGDWPGTLGLRRSALVQLGGYRGDVLFENFQLVAELSKAARQREVVALDLFVARRPPPAGHFWSQRVRQAYDELARPRRFAFQLTWLPLMAGVVLVSRRRRSASTGAAAAAAGLAPIVAAEIGRRRGGGREVFPWWSSLAGPVWAGERAVCSWLALLARARGGVRYRDVRIQSAARPPADLGSAPLLRAPLTGYMQARDQHKRQRAPQSA